MRVFHRKEDAFLLGYQFLIYALLLGFFCAFGAAPWWGRALLLWIGTILAGRIEAILHWTTHHPIFRDERLNLLHRLTYGLIPAPAIWYRYLHFHHHRFNNGTGDLTTTLDDEAADHRGVLEYLLLSLVKPNFRPFLRAMKPEHQRECMISFGLTLLLAAALAWWHPLATLAYWIPVTWIASALVVALYNYTDHVPSEPTDEFRYATYAETRTPYQKLLSWLDLHNIATHLTHHRFPYVYWADLPGKQQEWIAEYQARRSPVSYAHNSGILFNPFAFLRMVWRVQRHRRQLRLVRESAARTAPA